MSMQPDAPTQAGAPDDPEASRRIAQPPSAPEGLRAALALIAPDALPTFDAERAATLRQPREQVKVP